MPCSSHYADKGNGLVVAQCAAGNSCIFACRKEEPNSVVSDGWWSSQDCCCGLVPHVFDIDRGLLSTKMVLAVIREFDIVRHTCMCCLLFILLLSTLTGFSHLAPLIVNT